MKFNAMRDLDVDLLKQRAYAEAAEIFSKPSTRDGRTIDKIREAVMYGQAAEVYLVQHHNFTDDARPFKDVFNPVGEAVEVKVTEGDYYVPFVLKRCNEAASQAWRKYASILYIFIGDKSSLDYNLYGIYHWNGNNFIKENE